MPLNYSIPYFDLFDSSLSASPSHTPHFKKREGFPPLFSFHNSYKVLLLNNLCYYACTYCTATFTNCKSLSFFHCNWGNKFCTLISMLSPGMHISVPSGNPMFPVTSRRSKEELWTISIEERCMRPPSSLVNTYTCAVNSVCGWNGSRLSYYLSTYNVITVNTTKQCTYTVTCHCLIQCFFLNISNPVITVSVGFS